MVRAACPGAQDSSVQRCFKQVLPVAYTLPTGHLSDIPRSHLPCCLPSQRLGNKKKNKQTKKYLGFTSAFSLAARGGHMTQAWPMRGEWWILESLWLPAGGTEADSATLSLIFFTRMWTRCSNTGQPLCLREKKGQAVLRSSSPDVAVPENQH